ncbi:hypothetical protein [Geosporobacter ferrireducens]|uniref:Uncharacterized protein n=1 Tax=Geosporobacter ferrireducens TaxID=1424294 RepID=A0A1D8GGE8_9FIRM|nr:hypothetical protein [Geosporobacter ferrireducens]AOT69956.1 hypothetical protein Gferi_10390 [Geosporobacter ferrireducens]
MKPNQFNETIYKLIGLTTYFAAKSTNIIAEKVSTSQSMMIEDEDIVYASAPMTLVASTKYQQFDGSKVVKGTQVSSNLSKQAQVMAYIFAVDDVYYFGLAQKLTGTSKADWESHESSKEFFDAYNNYKTSMEISNIFISGMDSRSQLDIKDIRFRDPVSGQYIKNPIKEMTELQKKSMSTTKDITQSAEMEQAAKEVGELLKDAKEADAFWSAFVNTAKGVKSNTKWKDAFIQLIKSIFD